MLLSEKVWQQNFIWKNTCELIFDTMFNSWLIFNKNLQPILSHRGAGAGGGVSTSFSKGVLEVFLYNKRGLWIIQKIALQYSLWFCWNNITLLKQMNKEKKIIGSQNNLPVSKHLLYSFQNICPISFEHSFEVIPDKQRSLLL